MGLHRSRLPHPLFREIDEPVHAVQFYETDAYLVENISRFIGHGLSRGDAGIVIGVPEHRREIERRLLGMGLDLVAMSRDGAYVSLDAAETLSNFIKGDSCDVDGFRDVVGGVVSRARRTNGSARGVRAFGEMVALLWGDGRQQAALELERAWDDLCREVNCALVCAYPTSLFETERGSPTALSEIGSAHTLGAHRAA